MEENTTERFRKLTEEIIESFVAQQKEVEETEDEMNETENEITIVVEG